MTPEERIAIWEQAARLCGICGEPVALGDLEIDHIRPRMVGGTDALTNLRAAHRRCNRRQGRLDQARYPEAERTGVTNLNMRLDPVLKHDLDQLALSLNLSRTSIVRLAVREAAERRSPREVGQRQKPQPKR